MIDYGTPIRRAWLFGTDDDAATELDSRRCDAVAWLRSRGWYRGDVKCVHVYRNSSGALTSPYPNHRQAPLLDGMEITNCETL